MFFRPEIKLIAIGTGTVVRSVSVHAPSTRIGLALVDRISVFAHCGAFIDVSASAVLVFITFIALLSIFASITAIGINTGLISRASVFSATTTADGDSVTA